jgi:hypothetical protein
MDLSREQLEFDLIQRQGARERLGDFVSFNQCRHDSPQVKFCNDYLYFRRRYLSKKIEWPRRHRLS